MGLDGILRSRYAWFEHSVFSTSLQVCYAPGHRLCCCHQLVCSVLENVFSISIHVARAQALPLPSYPSIPARLSDSIRSLSTRGTMSSSQNIQPGMAVSKHFESWMEGATAEFFAKLASIRQLVPGKRFICHVGPEDVFFIKYGDPESLLQALVSTPSIWVVLPTNGNSLGRCASGLNMVGCI